MDIIARSFISGYGGLVGLPADGDHELCDQGTYTTGEIMLTDTTTGVTEPSSFISGEIFKIIESAVIKGDTTIYGSLRSALVGKSYTSFRITNALTTGSSFAMPQQIIIGQGQQQIRMTAYAVNARLTAAGLLCDLSAPELQNYGTFYKPKQVREDKKAVKKGENCGGFFLNENGSGIRIKL